MSGAANHRGKSKQDYATPKAFIAAVESRFGPITFDLAASAENAVVSAYYTEEDDSFSKDWSKLDGLLWLNPPFANIKPWAKKCAESAVQGARIAFLVPASVDSNWHRDYVHGRAMVLFCNGRLSFDGKNPFPKPCMLCMYGYPYGVPPEFVISSGYDVWQWRQEVAK